ncbi:Ribosomal RNA small subunit methyltransferase J [Candidatus Erwinia haradaeae]|uniref:Ribosomal RNA small subunit methyltransferase J n=1 Tax=Candidatus Erwinia haradaeae TaxID=1922217 RepID=A0A451D271_9GAMM|nr:Ribosomal RNA small subunit methyltransferase J [Candidatus Erwinia haradaeae]
MKINLIDESGVIGGNSTFILAARWKIQIDPNASLALVIKSSHLELQKRDEPSLGGIIVNFSSKLASYRRKFGGGKNEAVSKAVGIKKNYFPDILDATAGLARDAFILAACGCRVRMLERNPVITALLEDGLRRGYANQEIGPWLRMRLTLLNIPSLFVVKSLNPKPDVIYIDPMYPEKKKNSLVKKEMRILKSLIGADEDADKLLQCARMLATKRIVVKRPRYAQSLDGMQTNNFIKTKNHRFDIYSPIDQ